MPSDLNKLLAAWEGQKKSLLRGPYDHIDTRRLPKEPPPALPYEFSIPEEQWFSHCLLLAQTGSGKTNAIRWRLSQLIPRIAKGKASVVLIEPKGSLIDEVLHHPDVIAMGDRCVVLEAGDPAITVNILEGSRERVGRILATLSMDMQPLQRQALTMALRAMHATGERTIDRLLDIVRDGKKALDLTSLPRRVAKYFERDYSESRFVTARLNTLFTEEVFEALFGDRTTFNMFDALQRGTFIVVKQNDKTNLYARFWIEEVLDCMRPRFTIKKTPAYLIIDEAQNFVDQHVAKMLDEGRSAEIGIFLACHYLDQGPIAPLEVRNAVLTNTVLKFVASTSSDAHALGRSLGATKPEFFNTLPEYTFAFFKRGMQQAEAVKLPLVEFPRGERPTKPALPPAPKVYIKQTAVDIKLSAPEPEPPRKRTWPPR